MWAAASASKTITCCSSCELRTIRPHPCAARLRVLQIQGSDLRGSAVMAELGSMMAAGELPALEELRVSLSYGLGDAAIKALCEALTDSATSPVSVRVLSLRGLTMGSRGMCAIVDALERGAFGSRMEELCWFVPDRGPFHDDGQALKRLLKGDGCQHLLHLRSLSVTIHSSSKMHSRIIKAVRKCCPAVQFKR